MAKKYVVFDGLEPGVYDTWAECQAQTKGVKGAKFKSFKTYEEAKKAFDEFQHQEDLTQEEIDYSISTDASCLGSPGPTEYQIVYTKDARLIYGSEVFPLGTNNLGEFLGLVKSMQILEERDEKDRIIFTDSVTAMSWVRKKSIKTTMKRDEVTEKIFAEIDAALAWLVGVNVDDFTIIKWEKSNGEIAADFSRK